MEHATGKFYWKKENKGTCSQLETYSHSTAKAYLHRYEIVVDVGGSFPFQSVWE